MGEKRKPVSLEIIHTLAYSQGLPLCIIQTEDRWTFVIQRLQPTVLAYQQMCTPGVNY